MAISGQDADTRQLVRLLDDVAVGRRGRAGRPRKHLDSPPRTGLQLARQPSDADKAPYVSSIGEQAADTTTPHHRAIGPADTKVVPRPPLRACTCVQDHGNRTEPTRPRDTGELVDASTITATSSATLSRATVGLTRCGTAPPPDLPHAPPRPAPSVPPAEARLPASRSEPAP
jgi:hypothetical protein